MRPQAAIEAELASGLPQSAVKTRQGKGSSPALSYVDQHYVLTRLIEVFGPLAVDTDTRDLVCVCEEQDAKGRWVVSYRATVSVCATFDSSPPDGPRCYMTGRVTKVGSGFGSGIDAGRGAAHEKALKEAETDALKRAVRQLGNNVGLALYDKEQAGVIDDSEPAPKKARKAREPKPLPEGCMTLEELRALVAEGSDASKLKFKLAFPPSRAHRVFTDDEAKALAAEATAKWAANQGAPQ